MWLPCFVCVLSLFRSRVIFRFSRQGGRCSLEHGAQGSEDLRRCGRRQDDLGEISCFFPLSHTWSHRTDSGQGVVPKVKWLMVGYMTVVHLMALWGAYLFVADFRWQTLAVVVITFWLSGLGITCGAHRLWSHRSFKVRGFFSRR